MGKFVPHASPTDVRMPSTSQGSEEERPRDEELEEGSVNDWVAGGPVGTKTAVLVFRSCVLASRTPSMESTTKSVGLNTGAAVLLSKAKSMARRMAEQPLSHVQPRSLMHEVLETFGNTVKYPTQAMVVKHVSDGAVPRTASVEEQGHEAVDRRRDIDEVLQDLKEITLKKCNIENTTAVIKDEPAKAPEPPPPKEKAAEDRRRRGKACKRRRSQPAAAAAAAGALVQPPDSSSSSELLVKDPEVFKVLESDSMPARALHMTYRLQNTETKLLHRLLQAHGLREAAPEARDYSLLWTGLHPKPDLLRSLTSYQRVNHFPRSYELTRKDKLFKNVEKMQYFRGLKHFDFIPTTFLMPAEYKGLCTAHLKTKGPWIVKPAASSRGRGIYIVQSPEQIPKGENVVVAKYIDKPLLIGGHKCDLRLYVCVTSIDPLLVYLYEEGLVRFATVKYDKTNKNLWNPCMHLCNYSINKYHTDYIKCDDPNAGNVGHKWSLSALLRYLRKQGRDTTQLMASVEDLVVKSVLSSAQTIAAAARAFVPNFFNCFELFGYDILVDDMLKPWLIEINLSPSLACESPLDARVKSALLADTLTLVGLPAVPARAEPASLRARIGACRRVHSAETGVRAPPRPPGPAGPGPGSGPGAGPGPLTGEELRLVRAVRAQYARRGGYVRIFPSQNSWQKYAQYLDPVSGIPICSTSLNNNATSYAAVQHNYNLLVHAHVLPNFRHRPVDATLTDTPQRLKRYEAVAITSAAPAVCLGEPPAAPAASRRAKERVKQMLNDGLKLTRGEGRRAFGLYLTHVLKRLGSGRAEQAARARDAQLVLRFLKRASAALRMPYTVQGPPTKMCDKDRCAIIAKQLNDFLYMYYRETDLYTDSADQQGCVSNMDFAQFLYMASEADLEDVLLLLLRQDAYQATFLGDERARLCVDLPPARLRAAPARHTLLRHLACLSCVNTRRWRQVYVSSKTELTDSTSSEPTSSERGPPEGASSDADLLLKDSLREEKPLSVAMKYARS